jgi:hypothetical protein
VWRTRRRLAPGVYIGSTGGAAVASGGTRVLEGTGGRRPNEQAILFTSDRRSVDAICDTLADAIYRQDEPKQLTKAVRPSDLFVDEYNHSSRRLSGTNCPRSPTHQRPN